MGVGIGGSEDGGDMDVAIFLEGFECHFLLLLLLLSLSLSLNYLNE